jgi:hypothetical protein
MCRPLREDVYDYEATTIFTRFRMEEEEEVYELNGK